MAQALVIEEESGTYRGHWRTEHNGYYAGDFSTATFDEPRRACAR